MQATVPILRRLVPVSILAAIFLAASGCATVPYEAPPDGLWADIGEPAEGLVPVMIRERWGYANPAGQVAIVPQFAAVQPFSEGYAAVRLTNRWGFIDHRGTYVVRPTYLDAGPFSEGLAAVQTGEGWGYVNQRGRLVIPIEFDEARPFSQGLAAVRLGSRWGYVHTDGRIAIAFTHKAAGEFAEGLAPAATLDHDDEWGYINRRGEYSIQPAFDRARPFTADGYAAVLVDGKWGFIDRSGSFVVNPRFDHVRDFADGYAGAEEDGLWGVLDSWGRFSVAPRWQALGAFRGGIARAVLPSGEVRVVNVRGEIGALRADPQLVGAREAAARAGTPAEPTVTINIEVRDHLSNTPVAGFRITTALGDYGEYAIPSPPESGPDGRLLLTLPENRYNHTAVLLAEKPGYFSRDLDVADHKTEGYILRVLSLAADIPRIEQARCSWKERETAADILTEQANFIFRQNDEVTVDLAVFAGGFRIKKYFLQQGTKRIESARPSFTFAPGRTFSVGEDIYAGVIFDYNDATVAVPTLMRINDDPELRKPIAIPASPAVSLPQDLPMIAGGSHGFSFPGLIFTTEIKDDLITLYFGVDVEARRTENAGWQGPFKSWINDRTGAATRLGELWAFWFRNNPAPASTGEGFFSVKGGALGYVELAYNDRRELEVVGGRLALLGSFGYTYFYQGVIWVIPYYATFSAGSQITLTFAAEREPIRFGEFFTRNVTLTLSPFIDGELGVGVYGLASAGLAFHAQMDMNFHLSQSAMSGHAVLDLLFRLRLLFVFSYERRLTGAKWDVPERRHASELENLRDILSLDEERDFKMESRAYLANGTQWHGELPPPQAPKGGDPFVVQPLKSHILPGSEPRLILFGGREYLFWIDDAGSGRMGADRTALTFSQRNSDGSWSRPQIVHDDGTGDYHFDVIEHRGALYAAWQNTTRVFGREQATIHEVSTASEVLVAALNRESGAFEAPARMETRRDAQYYGLPRFASDGRTLFIVFAENDAGDSLLKSGNTAFRYEAFEGAGWSGLYRYSFLSNQPVIDWDLLAVNGVVQVIAVVDEDRNLQTLHDRIIVRAHTEQQRGQTYSEVVHLTGLGVHGNPRVVDWNGSPALFYYEAADPRSGTGSIRYFTNVLRVSSPSTGTAVFAAPRPITGAFDLIGGPNRKLAILLAENVNGLSSVPKLIMYSPTRGTWGLPTRIGPDSAFLGKRAEAVHGTWVPDGRIHIAYRSITASTAGREGDPPDTTLVFASTIPAPDLVVSPDSIYRYYGPTHGGELVTIEVDVLNGGLDTAQGVALDVRWHGAHGPRTGHFSVHKHVVLRPGERTRLPVDIRLPRSAENPFELFVEAKVLYGEERNYLNNGTIIPFAEPDIAIGTVQAQRSGFERTFRVPIENRGPLRIRGIELIVSDQLSGEVIRTFRRPDLEPFRTDLVDFSLNLGELHWKAARKLLVFQIRSTDMTKPGYHTAPYPLINPYSLPAFTLGVFGARALPGGYVLVEAVAANNHPKAHRGNMLIELLDHSERVVSAYTTVVQASAGSAAVVTRLFKTTNVPDGYTVRLSMSGVELPGPDSPLTGRLPELGGASPIVEAPVMRTGGGR